MRCARLGSGGQGGPSRWALLSFEVVSFLSTAFTPSPAVHFPYGTRTLATRQVLLVASDKREGKEHEGSGGQLSDSPPTHQIVPDWGLTKDDSMSLQRQADTVPTR